MGFADNMKEAMDAATVKKIELGYSPSLEEIFDKMNSRASDFPDAFKIKKGLLGSHIGFEKNKDLRVTVNISVKGNVVKITPVQDNSKTTVSVGGFRVASKGTNMNTAMNRFNNLGEYMNSIVDTLREVLEA